MALPHEVVRVTLSGTMFGGAEIWTTGFFLGHPGANADPITGQGMADVSAAWETFFKSANSYISAQYTYTMLKMARVNLDGHTIPDSANFHAPGTPAVGGASGSAMPPQVALVASLASSVPRGLASKGRMFLPGVNASVFPNGKIDDFSRNKIADNLKIFFDSIYNDADLPGNPVLASVGRGLLHTDGNIRAITQVKVGNVYDTQRRRRNALVEEYTNRNVAGA